MKIKSMTATFGRLEGVRLELGPGLNLIHAPNEGGKSTWCAFWRAMLYGIDTRDRDKKGRLADKNRYQPWSGAPMEGELILEWQGREIAIRRGPRGAVPFGAFSAVYTATGEPVPGFTAETCGELLTGVGREVFERSALLGGGELAVSAAPELEKRIAALVSSGQEDVSFSQADARLREWLNHRKVNRSVGLIPKLEEELSQVSTTLDRLEQITSYIARWEGDRVRLEQDRAQFTADRDRHRQLAQQELDQRFDTAQQELESAQSQLSNLEREYARFGVIPDRDRLKQAQGDLQYLKVLDEEIRSAQAALREAEAANAQAHSDTNQPFFTGMTPEEASAKVRKDLGDHASCLKAAHSKAVAAKLCPALGAGLALALTAFQLAARKTLLGLNFYIGLGLLALGLVLGVLNHSSARSWTEKADKILTRWSVKSPKALEDLLNDYCARFRAAEAAAAHTKSVRGTLNDQMARRENCHTELLRFVHSFAPQVHDLFGCSAALSRALSLEHDLAMARERVDQRRLRLEDLAAQGGQPSQAGETLTAPEHSPEACEAGLAQVGEQLSQVNEALNQARGVQSSLGDPAALAARKEELEDELARRREELEALTIAVQALREASEKLQERFSPALNRLAGNYLSRLTGDRYSSLSLNRELEGEAARRGDVLPHSALYLSRGTVDQLYLAVRLAVCRLCLPDKPPVVLDDALTAFDDERMALALDLIRELAQEQQVLLFTCQNREGAALADAPNVTRLELS